MIFIPYFNLYINNIKKKCALWIASGYLTSHNNITSNFAQPYELNQYLSNVVITKIFHFTKLVVIASILYGIACQCIVFYCVHLQYILYSIFFIQLNPQGQAANSICVQHHKQNCIKARSIWWKCGIKKTIEATEEDKDFE